MTDTTPSAAPAAVRADPSAIGVSGTGGLPLAPRWPLRRVERVGMLAVFVAAVIIGLVRVPLEVYDSVWAEDGKRFLTDALDPATAWLLLEPYAGYLHAVPRFWALVLTAGLPLPLYGIGVTVVSVLTTAAVAAAIFHFSRAVLAWLPARFAAAGVVVLVPTAGAEVLGDLANLHWYFLMLAPWLLLYLPSRWGSSVLAGIVALAATLTEIQMAGFAPLALWRIRDRRRWPMLAGYVIGIALQAFTTLTTPREVSGGALPRPVDTLAGYLVQVVTSSVIGSTPLIGHLVVAAGMAVPITIFTVFVMLWLLVMVRGTGIQRLFAVVALPASLVLWSSAYLSNLRAPTFAFASYSDSVWLGGNDPIRYGAASGALLLTIVVLAADVLRKSSDRRPWPWPGAPRDVAGFLLLALATVVAVACTSIHTERGGSRSWSMQVEQGIIACSAPGGDDDLWVVDLAPAGWTVEIACSELE